jgi:hypothetical protein
MPLSTVLAVEVLREKAAARQVKADARTIARRGYRTPDRNDLGASVGRTAETHSENQKIRAARE